jgi:hypothetical protein
VSPLSIFILAPLIFFSLISLYLICLDKRVRTLAEALHVDAPPWYRSHFFLGPTPLRGLFEGKRYEISFDKNTVYSFHNLTFRISVLHPFVFEAQIFKRGIWGRYGKGVLGKLGQFIYGTNLAYAETSDCLGDIANVAVTKKAIAEGFLRSPGVNSAIRELFTLGVNRLEIDTSKIIAINDPAVSLGHISSPDQLIAALRLLVAIVSN